MEYKKINNINTTKIKGQNVPFITYHTLNDIDWVINGFSTRIGGVSDGQYAQMNLSFMLGDSAHNVNRNFHVFGDAIGVSVEDMVYSHQTHTTNVMRVGSEHKGMGILKERNYADIDGIVTNEPGLCLVTSYADCVPLYFVDTVNRAIGLSHSGWKGTVGNICKNTVELMAEEFGTNPADLIACIGPSICVDCYEVSEDVANKFKEAYSKTESVEILTDKGNGKYQLNLHKANYYNMINCGILSKNISMPDICTCCNPDFLHSHRASGGKRGGLCAFLAIK